MISPFIFSSKPQGNFPYYVKKGSISMINSTNKANNPMSEYLLQIQLIVSNTEFKNGSEASKYETLDSKLKGEEYVRAVLKTDIFESYEYDSNVVYDLLNRAGYDDDKIMYMIKNPTTIPQVYKAQLLEDARNVRIANYVEPNKYYMDLTGNPSSDKDEVLVPDEFYEIYENDAQLQRNMPIHKMPYKYQELFMNSKYYKEIIDKYPDITYLKYIGSNSIPIEVSRPAKDGEIIKINTNKLSTYNDIFGNITVSPSLIHLYTNIYQETRDYVYNTLKGNFSEIYENYDSFIRFLTIYLSIGDTLNELMKKSTSMIYMNNVTANNFFMLYGLPSVIMEGSSMIDFLKKFRLLLMDKGTNVVYRVKDMIGYEYTDIYTLVMVKQQIFEDGVPIYVKDENGNKVPKQRIVFRRLGTADDNTSYFKFREQDKEYPWEEIYSGDPRWWNSPEVESMLNDMNYTLSNSKYIQLSTHMSMEDIYWQSTILLRGLLDRKQETSFAQLSLNYNINGSSDMSIFEAVLILVIMMDWQLKDFAGRTLSGDIYIPNGMYDGKMACLDMLFNGLKPDGTPNDLKQGIPFKISSFNFDIRDKDPLFYNSIRSMDYIEPDIFFPMLDSVLDMEYNNVGEVLMKDVKSIYNYLRDKLLSTTTIHQFRQVTDVFNHLFLVDPIRDWYQDLSFDTDAILCDEFQITQNELSSLKSAFPEKPNTTEYTGEFSVEYNNKTYPISLFEVLNYDVTEITINNSQPFNDSNFIKEFNKVLATYTSTELLKSQHISQSIKSNYKKIIESKIILDTGNTQYGPKTFEAMLFRYNPSLYAHIMLLKSEPASMVLLMRSIVKALENYTNTSLTALQFRVVGVDEYMDILKEVISYFKSYMVEFTKTEFVYIFGGIFDNGGNSDMLRLYDEIAATKVKMIPKDSLSLYDVSYLKTKMCVHDDNTNILHDEAIFRIKATHEKLRNLGYEVWYDDGKSITKRPLPIPYDEKVVANIVKSSDSSTSPSAYKIIINKQNTDSYYGNTR